MSLSASIHFDSIWAALSEQFGLGLNSIHGPDHWKRVESNGIRLATATEGADLLVVKLFAVFHDSQRINEYTDPDHGPAAERLVRTKQGDWFTLNTDQLELLCLACRKHTDGEVTADPTIGCCWDADRLDLPRVGMTPHRDYMSTAVGKTLASIQR